MPPTYSSPNEATKSLTEAFKPTTNAQKTAIANAAALVPNKIQPTVIGTPNIEEKNQENIKKVTEYPQGGQVMGTDGIPRNADGSIPSTYNGENGIRMNADGSPVAAPKDAIQSANGLWYAGGQAYAAPYSDTSGTSNTGYDSETQKYMNQMDSLKSEMDATGAAMIENIKSQYAGYKAQQEQANKSAQGGLTSLLIRGGSLQTASSEGILNSQVSYGIQQLADLNTKEQNAIIAAKQAMQTNDYKVLDRQLSVAETARKEKQAAATKIAENLQKARDEQKKRLKDSVVVSAMETTSDPKEIYSLLRQKGYDVSSQEVADTIKNLASNVGGGVDKLTGEAKNYAILSKMSGMLPPTVDSLGKYLAWNRDLTTSKTANAAGNGTMTSSQFTNEQIALSAIPTQLRNSDTELKRYLEGIRLGLKEGKTPYQVADELMGYSVNNPDEFSNGLRQYMAVANLSAPEIGNVARLLNAGNKAGAIAVVENKVLQSQKQNDPESFVGEATPRYYSEKVAEIKKTIQDAGLMDSIGPIEGTATSIFNAVPFTRRAEALKIQGKVTSLVAEMRNHLSGTAVTESEKKFLEPLVASLTDKKGIFINKLDEIANNSLTRYNQTRASGGLPELNQNQLLDKGSRVSLYANGAQNTNNSIDNEHEAETRVTEYGNSNRAAQAQILQMVNDGVPYEKIRKALNI